MHIWGLAQEFTVFVNNDIEIIDGNGEKVIRGKCTCSNLVIGIDRRIFVIDNVFVGFRKAQYNGNRRRVQYIERFNRIQLTRQNQPHVYFSLVMDRRSLEREHTTIKRIFGVGIRKCTTGILCFDNKVRSGKFNVGIGRSQSEKRGSFFTGRTRSYRTSHTGISCVTGTSSWTYKRTYVFKRRTRFVVTNV